MTTARKLIKGQVSAPPVVSQRVVSTRIAGVDNYYKSIATDGTDFYVSGRFNGSIELVLHKYDGELNPLWTRNFRGTATSGTNESFYVTTDASHVYIFGQTTALTPNNTRGSGYKYDSAGNFVSSKGLYGGTLISWEGCYIDSAGKFHVVGYQSDGSNNYPIYARYDSAFTTLEGQWRVLNNNNSFTRSVVEGDMNEIVLGVDRRGNGAARFMCWNTSTDTLVKVLQATNPSNSNRVTPWKMTKFGGHIYAACLDTASRGGPQAGTVIKFDLDLNVVAHKMFHGTGNTNFRDVKVDASGVYICGGTNDHSGGSDLAIYIARLNSTTLLREAELAFYQAQGAFSYQMVLNGDALYVCAVSALGGDRKAAIIKVNKDLSLSSISQTCNTDLSLVTPNVNTVQDSGLTFQIVSDTPLVQSFTEIDPTKVDQSPTLIVDGPCDWNP